MNSTSANWDKHWKQLRAIEVALRMRRKGALGPRSALAFFVAACVLAASYGVAYLSAKYGAVGAPNLLVNSVVFGAAIVAFWLVQKYSSVARTYSGRIDALLADYDPVSKEAYRDLQGKVKEARSLDTDMVIEWLDREREAVRRAAGWRMPSEESRFLNKNV